MPNIEFGAGFAEGLTGAILAKQKTAQDKADKQKEMALRAAQLAISTGRVRDYNELRPIFDIALGTPDSGGKKAKKPKEGEPDPHAILEKFLTPTFQNSAAQEAAGAPAATERQIFHQPPVGNDLPSQGEITGTRPYTPQQSSGGGGGISFLTDEEVAQKNAEAKALEAQQVITTKIDLARKLHEQFPDILTLEESLDAVGLRIPNAGANPYQSVAGEVNGKPAFAVLNHANGSYEDPITHQPIPGFVPRTTTGSTSLGADRESISRELFGKPAAQLTPTEMAVVNKQVETMAASKAGAVTTARGDAASKVPLTTAQRFSALNDLQSAWRKAEAPKKEMDRQLGLMEVGLRRFNEGDKIGGSQAVLVTFQKILDPASVVRESEYARTPEGLGLMQRIQGMYERLKQGGAGVPAEDLAAMVETAREFVTSMQSYNDVEHDRIESTAKDAGLNPDRVFGVAAAAPGRTAPATTPTSKALPDGKGGWKIQIPAPAP